MNPILTSIFSDKSLYENSDKPVITITGVPNSLDYLEIDNQSGNIVFSHSIELPSTGIANYTLDISSYKLGVYSAIASTSASKVSTTFTVGQISSPTIVSTIKSPLQQFKSGVPAQDVKCNQGLQLIFKAEDRSPACVTQNTLIQLIKRYWGIDPNHKWHIIGLGDTYKINQLIDFDVMYNGIIVGCLPWDSNVYVRDSSGNTVWQTHYSNGCFGPANPQPRYTVYVENVNSLGFGNVTIPWAGQYVVKIGDTSKNFTVTQ